MHSQRNTSQALHDGRVLEHLIYGACVTISAGRSCIPMYLQFCALGMDDGTGGRAFLTGLVQLTFRLRQLLQFMFSRASLVCRRVAGSLEIGCVPAGCCSCGWGCCDDSWAIVPLAAAAADGRDITDLY